MDKIIKMAQNGDTNALDALWEQTKKFAFAAARNFRATPSVGTEDLQQCAWIGFYTALQKHTGRYVFTTLVYFCVQNECQKALGIRTSKRDPETVSYDAPAPDGEQSMLALFKDDSLPENDMSLIDADLARDVRAAVAELPERERMLIETRWLGDDPLTLEQTGKAMGINRERVRQIEARAFDRLRADPVLLTYSRNYEKCGDVVGRGGLQNFLDTGASVVEHEAIRRIHHAERKQKKLEQKNQYAALLQSLADDGFLDFTELETLLPLTGT